MDWSQLNSTPRVAHSPAVPTAGGSGSNANVPATPTPAARTLPPTQPLTQASQASQPLSQAMAYYPNVYGQLQPGYGAGIGASQPTIPAKRLSDQMEALGTQMTTTQGSQPWRDDDEDEGGEDNELAAADELFVIINTNVVGIQYYDGECDFFPTPSIFHTLFTHPPTPASFLPSPFPFLHSYIAYIGLVGPGESVNLQREPGNPYDRNAIQVKNFAREQVGHIPRDTAKNLAGLMDRNMVSIEAVINDGNCEFVIRYGERRSDVDGFYDLVVGRPASKSQKYQLNMCVHILRL